MKGRQRIGKVIMSFVLTLALVLGMLPGICLTASAATYSSLTWVEDLQVGDILKPGAELSASSMTVTLQANGWGSEGEISTSEKQFSPEHDLRIQDGGCIEVRGEDYSYTYCYPYANNEKVSAWKVVSFEGGMEPWDPKTITLTGYAPPAREPVTEISSDTTLEGNIDGYVTITSDVTLDLAGYTITGGGYHSTIIINDGCTLTLTDSSTGKTGTITGGGGDAGGGVAVCNNATFNMQGGIIRGNSATSGGGVGLGGGTTFTMSGGTISNNSADNGGGVYSSGTSFHMTGGTIRDNSVGDFGKGGGVLIQNGNFSMSGTAVITSNNGDDGGGVYFAGGTFTMSSGTISENNADSTGGGVYLADGTFHMTGGTITGNSTDGWVGGGVYTRSIFNMSGTAVITRNSASTEGGGVYQDRYSGAVFTMTGGSITNNTSGAKGYAGVCIREDGTFNLSGSAVIDGNTHGGTEEDICLYPGTVIRVTGALTMENTMSVRRTDSNGNDNWTGTIAQGSNYTLTETDGAMFVASTTNRRAVYDSENHKEQLVAMYSVTYNGNGNTGGTVPVDSNSPYLSGSTVTVLSNTGGLTKSGNTFNGWNTAANGTGTPYVAGATFEITGNTTLYAQWEEEIQTADVSIKAGEGMTKTTDSGAAEQTNLAGSMTDVVYHANDGYYFPIDYSVEAVNGISVTRDSYTQITVSGTPAANAEIVLTAATAKTTPDAPTTATVTNCTTLDNNNGKLTGVTTLMEYKKSDAENWTAGTGSDITGLVPGTYYVRMKATDTANASANQELTITGYNASSYTVTYKVAGGTWSDGTITDKTETVQSGTHPVSVPTGMIAFLGYTGGSWNTNPAEATITEARTFTYTFTAEQVATVSKVPVTKNLNYSGSPQELVTAGETTGGTMQYALGENAITAPISDWSTSIPKATDIGTYYVWYKAVGTDGHADSAAACVTVTISEPSSGGGGGGYTIEPTTETAPSTPTETYTIPVENESTVNVQVDIQNGNAKVTEITEEDIHKVTEESSGEDSQGKTSENNTILIDLSGSTQEVKSVELSKTTMERLAETATSTENKIETVTVQLTNVTVELDAKTLSAVTQQAEGNSINLVVEDTNASTLNSDQQQALSEFTSASTFEAYFESAGSRIHDFRGGEATVSMKFTPAQGLSITHYHVYYVATSGKLERFVTRFIKTLIKAEKSDKKGASEGEGILQFTTTHFSDYAIVYDETMENATGQEEADDTSSGEDKTKTANGKSSYENGLSINKGLKVSQKGETIQISWGKVKGADGYDVYVQYCGKAFSSKPAMGVNREVTSVTIKKINGKKLNLKKNYKIFVVAYKNVAGKKKRLAKSIVAHIVGAKNTRYSNPKELTITSDTDVTLEKGKTSKIKARVILANAKRKSLSDAHAPMFRYASSDKKIATVDKKGKITAKKQGSCLIWVYAKNGYAKKVKVTVK